MTPATQRCLPRISGQQTSKWRMRIGWIDFVEGLLKSRIPGMQLADTAPVFSRVWNQYGRLLGIQPTTPWGHFCFDTPYAFSEFTSFGPGSFVGCGFGSHCVFQTKIRGKCLDFWFTFFFWCLCFGKIHSLTFWAPQTDVFSNCGSSAWIFSSFSLLCSFTRPGWKADSGNHSLKLTASSPLNGWKMSFPFGASKGLFSDANC